jgi:hypothetical protein
MTLLPDPLIAESLTLKNSVTGDIDLLIQPLTGLSYQELNRSRYSSILWVQLHTAIGKLNGFSEEQTLQLRNETFA